MSRRISKSVALTLACALPSVAHAQWIPTNLGAGADAEVRESAPAQNRGTSTEIASRVRNAAVPPDPNDGLDRNSLLYVRIDLAGVTLPPNFTTAFRLTYRNNNLLGRRIRDEATPDLATRTGMALFGLDPMAPGAAWDELTIAYENAPGLTPDGDVGTRDQSADLIPLVELLFPEIGTQNWLPVGGTLLFASPELDQFVADVLAGGATTVTFALRAIHDGNAPSPDWINFNYLFNPKEQTTLNQDPNYDADVDDPSNPLGSPWSGADNSTGDFSPALRIDEVLIPIQAIPAADALGLAMLAALVAGFALVRLRARSA